MLLLYLCNIQIRYLHPIIMLCHILLYLLISSLSTLRFGPRWAKVPWTFSASQPPLNPSRPCQVSHSHDASLRGVWTINIPSPHEPFVKCSVFKSLYSFVHSQIAYKIKYFLIVQTLSPCAFLCCMSAMVASRWHCHR